MRYNKKYLIYLALLALILTGCTITREQVRYRDEFFRPVVVIPQRSQPTHSADVSQLTYQIEQATKAALVLRDSLASLQNFTGDLLASTYSLIEKVSDLESKEFLTNTKHKELEQNIAQLQYENKQLVQQLNEIRARLFTDNQQPIVSPAFYKAKVLSNLHYEYNEGLILFKQKRYDEAYDNFSSLIEKGIEDDLSDNCEYWKGECSFAKKEYSSAIVSFQKVLEIKSSNKIIDAYYMLGKSYEQVGDFVKARWAFEELSLLYPKNHHARAVKVKLRAIYKLIPESQNKIMFNRPST